MTIVKSFIVWITLLCAAHGVFKLKHDMEAEFGNAFKQLKTLVSKTKVIDAYKKALAATTRDSMRQLESIEKADQAAMLATVKKGEHDLDALNAGLFQRLAAK